MDRKSSLDTWWKKATWITKKYGGKGYGEGIFHKLHVEID